MTPSTTQPPIFVRHRLLGCQPEPLGSYLKALAILRLVATQADPLAAAFWDAEGFFLDTVLEDQSLESFFLDRYQPTPVLSPWNSSSGFGPEGREELGVIESSSDPRLEPYRRSTQVARRLMGRPEWDGWTKAERISACRSELPDDCLGWIDATAVLADGNKPVFPPILGTGGNDGRLEFSRNFHRRLLDVLGLAPKTAARRREWLRAALYAEEAALPTTGSPGQFDAGGAGGPNSSPLGAADPLLNPWDWVFLIEGSMLFAAGAARRLSTNTGGRAAAPFTVASSALGYASAGAGESSRGELWLPLWGRPTPFEEVRSLFAEGRLDWRERHAQSGLDAAKAVASLGVDRGITGFSRHALLERNGLATVAAPIGRVQVSAERREKVVPLAELDDWLDRLRQASLPGGVTTALRATEAAEFALASGKGELIDVLIAASELDAVVARSPAARKKALRPLSISGWDGKDSSVWIGALLRSKDARSYISELRVALSLASARDESSPTGGIRSLLAPQWPTGTPAPVVGLGLRPITEVLADAHARRVVEVVRSRSAQEPDQVGVATGFDYGTAPPLRDVVAWVTGDLDEGLLGRLVEACLILDIKSRIEWGGLPGEEGFLPPEWCFLAPFYAPQPREDSGDTSGLLGRFEKPLLPEAEWPAFLAAGRAEPILAAARRRLRIAGFAPVPSTVLPRPDPETARRLGAALLLPQHPLTRRRLLDRICPENLDAQHGSSSETQEEQEEGEPS